MSFLFLQLGFAAYRGTVRNTPAFPASRVFHHQRLIVLLAHGSCCPREGLAKVTDLLSPPVLERERSGCETRFLSFLFPYVRLNS